MDPLPKLPPEFSSSITFVKINLPKVEGPPPDAEATMDIQNDDIDIPFLKKAYDGLELELTSYLEESLPDWIAHDFSCHWLPPIAARLGISKAFYSIINAWFLAYFGTTGILINGTDIRTKPEDFMTPPKWVPFETKVAYKRFEVNWIFSGIKPNATGVSDGYRTGVTMKGTDVFIVRHCNEFEGAWLNLLGELHNKQVIPLGLMPPVVSVYNTDDDKSWIEIMEWLDAQNSDSVLYVALGSEVSLNQAQVTELALGLELSGLKFIWILRKPSGSNESEQIELPEGFEKRIEGKGIVWKKWAPQQSVGGFLTHCGWGSCIEGLMFAKPLIMLPFFVDHVEIQE